MNVSTTITHAVNALYFSPAQLSALKPIVLADFMRPVPHQEQARSGMQNRITRQLLDWLEPALAQTFAASAAARLWEADDLNSLPVSEIYASYDVDPGSVGWIQLYRAEPNYQTLELLRAYFEGSFVIGFELSPFQKAAFNVLGVPYVSIAIHPVRFMDDYKFMLNSNFGNLQALLPFAVSQEQIGFAAQLRRAQFRQTSLDLRGRAAVLFGQVEIDTALIGERGLVSLQDHITEVSELCAEFDTIYFKPHPYGANVAEQALVLSQFENVKFSTHNPYALLAAPEVEAVAALTSSVLTEAPYFGKTPRALSNIWQDHSATPCYGIEILSTAFWKALLDSVDANKMSERIMPSVVPMADVTLKSLLNVSWETHGIPVMPASEFEVVLNRGIQIGLGHPGNKMLCGSGWKVPSTDHCWAGPRDAFLSFRLPPHKASDLTAKIIVNGMATKDYPVLLQIHSEGQILGETVLETSGLVVLNIPLKASSISVLGDVLLEFVCNHAHSPKFINGGSDQRALAFALRRVEIMSPKAALSFYIGETIHARDTIGNTRFMPYGWHEAEEDGVWTNGRRSRLRVATDPLPDRDIELTLGNVRALLSEMVPVNALVVSVDGVAHYTHKFRRGEPGEMGRSGIDIVVPLPREVFCKPNGIVNIDLDVVACHSPALAGFSSDTRELGLMIQDFRFNSAIRSVATRSSTRVANVIGPFNIHTGLSVMARNSFLAIKSAMDDQQVDKTRFPTRLLGPGAVNFNNSNHLDESFGFVQHDQEGSDINIFVGDVTRVAQIVRIDGNTLLKNRYNICYGAWELETIPTYLANTRYVDEYWGLSNFIADAARKRLNIPVHAFPLPVNLHFPDLLAPRARFGIPEEAFAFLFTFSVDSTMARKNPEATLDAFQTAFPDPSVPVVMVFKSMIRQASKYNREAFDAFKARAKEDPRVILVEETLSLDENASLYMRCDAYISLHRAEGFGLTMAEAMGYGKPTIGTGYSGNLDFMCADNSCLVKYAKVKMAPGLYHGQQREWAEPDTDDAARHMRRVFDDVRFREKIARAGKRTIYQEFSTHAVGKKLLARLSDIHEARK
ncbi:MAG: glycosyltransferase [Roseobacter sp.]|nr:glycosyltransferase [Roseobacter sp.]